MTTSNFSCTITSTDPVVLLGLEVWLDDCKIFDQEHVSKVETLKHDFSDEDGEDVLKFVLKNKLGKHTRLDADNNIISDARIHIDNIMFEDIDIKQIVITQAEYRHNFNGHGADTTEKFYGEMGCNGTVTLKFSTPVYLWLLEKM